MSPEDVHELFEWIEPLRCQEHLQSLRIADFPTMTKEGRSKLHKDLYRAGFPSILIGEPKALTLEDLARMTNG